MKRPGHKGDSIIAMIPARMGSTRLAMKNLALLNGRPLIYYAIKAAKDSGVFERVVVNSEDPIFRDIAIRYKTEFYLRPQELGTSTAKSDLVVYDFLKKNICDAVAWVNTTSPLQSGEEIRQIVGYFRKEKLDSLITVRSDQVHCVYKDRPVNFKMNGLFAQTQEMVPVQPFVYSVMMWRRGTFMRAFEKKGSAFFSGKVGFYPVSRFSAIIIKRKEDLMMADLAFKALQKNKGYRIRYDRIADIHDRRIKT